MPAPLKDLYSTALIEEIADAFVQASADFAKDTFVRFVLDEAWEARELKQRMFHVADAIHHTLAMDYPQALAILLPVAAQFSGLEHMLFPAYVERYGLEDWERSIHAMEALTPQSSAEFAIRPFLKRYQERTLARMLTWTEHQDAHVRRLASEGCRPRLPWAMALPAFKQDPAPILPILQALKDDESEYVRRSVANNLNDIAKDHPDTVISIAQDWLQDASKERRWLVKHACRTLLKQGHPDALALFGFPAPTHIEVTQLTLDKETLAIGETLHFSFLLRTSQEKLGPLRVEYAIYYKKARGYLSKKVFQIGELDCEDSQRAFRKKQSFQERTTRKHYPGTHAIGILVNGHELTKVEFDLEE